jgi:hypothetical protein
LRQLQITRSLNNRMGTGRDAKLVSEAGPQGTAYERGAHCPSPPQKNQASFSEWRRREMPPGAG